MTEFVRKNPLGRTDGRTEGIRQEGSLSSGCGSTGRRRTMEELSGPKKDTAEGTEEVDGCFHFVPGAVIASAAGSDEGISRTGR
jgi:hypothetical protein